MVGRTGQDERLDRAPFRLPRPRRAELVRWSVAAGLLALAALVLFGAAPAPPPPARVACPAPTPAPIDRAVPPPGTVGVPVAVGTNGAARVVRAGDRVDVITAPAGSAAEVVAENVLVLSVQAADDGPDGGPTLYVAARADVARRLAGVAPNARAAITVRPP
jgi:hypothetical protein